jgi:hypothetical protein
VSNLIIRPSSVDGLGYYNTAWAVTPPGPYADAIDEIVADGDASYVSATVPGAAFTTKLGQVSGESWPRPSRIRSLMVVATVMRTGALPSTFRVRWRYGGINYDSQLLSVNTNVYREFYLVWPQMPTGAGWTSSVLLDFELGMVYVSGDDELRCTKLEVQVQTEQEPHFRLEPAAAGVFASDWALSVPTVPSERMVNGAFDGDLSYLQSITPGHRSTFVPSVIPPYSAGLSIDRVQTRALVRTTDSVTPAAAAPLLVAGGVPYRGGTNTLTWSVAANSYPSEFAWYILEAEYLNCPTTGWPSGLPIATAWTPLELAGVEFGVENGSIVPVRCTQLGLDVFLKPTPLSTFNLFPTANDALHHSLPPLVPNAGEQAWQDIDEDPPDNFASYIGATTTDRQPCYGTFSVGPIPVIPAGEQILALELRTRIIARFGGVVVAHVVNDQITGETWIGKPIVISGAGAVGVWFDIKEDLFTDPLLGVKWSAASLATYSFGWAILDGTPWMSRLRVQVQTIPDLFTAVPDPVDFQLTNDALFWINKSGVDGSIYEVDTFAVGRGGYNPAVPTTVVAVNPADIALADEALRRQITKVTYEAETPPWVATYWCRVPRHLLVGNTIGEIGLFARVLWSPIPGETGLVFLFALGHFGAQVCCENDVVLLPCRITYP